MHIEYYFDFSCPYAYLGSTRIEGVAERTGAQLEWRPMLLGGVYREIGVEDRGPWMSEAKARHNELDMRRWAERWQVPLEVPRAHPMRTVRALRALLAAPAPKWAPLIHALYRAYWQRGEDVSDRAVIARVLEEVGVRGAEAERALAANDDPAIKEELRRRTEEAVQRGVFGAPTMFVGGGDRDPLMFWGQDRLHLVEAAARGWRPDEAPPERREPPPAAPPREPATLEYWHDFSSPFSYLASTQVERIAARTGARLRWRPFLLGAVFKELGAPNVPIQAVPAPKRRWMDRDARAWASWWGVPFRWNSHFPLRTVTPLRVALLAEEEGRGAEVSRALYRAAWVEDRDVGEAETVAEVLGELGLDADALLARTREPEVKERLKQNTAEALEAGAFGAPTFIVRRPGREPSLYWGQDRLELVEDLLRAFA